MGNYTLWRCNSRSHSHWIQQWYRSGRTGKGDPDKAVYLYKNKSQYYPRTSGALYLYKG